MCEVKEEYINAQTGEVLDWDRVEGLKDNAMLKVRPELWREWDFEKNDESGFDVWKMTKGQDKRVWWHCKNHKNHKWNNNVQNRCLKNNNCPYCSNHKLLVGYNDMWTTNPKQASWLLNPEDGYKFMQNSNKKADWKCRCGEIIENKNINDISRRGLSCSSCSDGISYPQRFLYNLLKTLDISFLKEVTSIDKNWANNKKYDFYIPSLNVIIETHGGQHSKKAGFVSLGGRTLKEEQENDKYKRELALLNGVEHYIELDCSESNMDYIRNSIRDSKLVELLNFNNVDWKEVARLSEKSLVLSVWEDWNNGCHSTLRISEKYSLSRSTVLIYLKRGVRIGKCTYTKELSVSNFKRSGVSGRKKKKVVQLSSSNTLIKEWNSITQAIETFKNTSIGAVCRGKRKTANGYKWMYKKDYDQYIEQQNKAI